MWPEAMYLFERVLTIGSIADGAETGFCLVDGVRSSLPVRDLCAIATYAEAHWRRLDDTSVPRNLKIEGKVVVLMVSSLAFVELEIDAVMIELAQTDNGRNSLA